MLNIQEIKPVVKAGNMSTSFLTPMLETQVDKIA
jgi:hypothetical protein